MADVLTHEKAGCTRRNSEARAAGVWGVWIKTRASAEPRCQGSVWQGQYPVKACVCPGSLQKGTKEGTDPTEICFERKSARQLFGGETTIAQMRALRLGKWKDFLGLQLGRLAPVRKPPLHRSPNPLLGEALVNVLVTSSKMKSKEEWALVPFNNFFSWQSKISDL